MRSADAQAIAAFACSGRIKSLSVSAPAPCPTRSPSPNQGQAASHRCRRSVDLEVDRQAAARHARIERQTGNAGIAAGLGVADHRVECRHGLLAVNRHFSRPLRHADRHRRRDRPRKHDRAEIPQLACEKTASAEPLSPTCAFTSCWLTTRVAGPAPNFIR
jgi:hypothetical protein